MASLSVRSDGARYFGQDSPRELRDLERNASRATSEQMAKAASYLQEAFSGQYYAWFGGWALKLRGSDLPILIYYPDIISAILLYLI
jgi:hypothetical protein